MGGGGMINYREYSEKLNTVSSEIEAENKRRKKLLHSIRVRSIHNRMEYVKKIGMRHLKNANQAQHINSIHIRKVAQANRIYLAMCEVWRQTTNNQPK